MLFRRLARMGASWIRCISVACIAVIMGLPAYCTAQGDYANVTEQISQHLKFGEFARAIELAESLPPQETDQQLAKIAARQARSGATASAVRSVERIGNDLVRFKALSQQIFRPDLGGRSGGNDVFGTGGSSNSAASPGTGAAGGVTEQDFQPLISLIRSTISPDTWDDTNGDGTIQAYPAGVYVDSTGTLQKLNVDANRSLKRLGIKSRSDSGNRLVSRTSKLRKVSLNRLEKQAQLQAAQGRPVSDAVMNLAGIYEIEYLMLLPETNDVVIAGPAGEWQIDNDGHAINVDSGRPVLQLDDLVVCLRNSQRGALGNNGKFGCSITPRKQNLLATQQFLAASQLRGKAWRTKLRETLGLQDIEVFGIDPATHAGRVLVEADYRMKLVAMGLEPSIPEIPSYMSRLDVGPNGEVEPMDVVRWWFTMNYDEIATDQEHEVFTLGGTGVKVLSENEFIDEQGERVHTGESDRNTAGFARDFTKHFDKIADEYPVYRRLKNLFDLSIVSTIIRNQDLDDRADWNLTYFGNDPEYADYVYQPPTESVPQQVNSVMNHRLITRRKESSTVKHTLVGVSGGITFDAIQVINSKAQVIDAQNLDAAQKTSRQTKTSTAGFGNWWWD